MESNGPKTQSPFDTLRERIIENAKRMPQATKPTSISEVNGQTPVIIMGGTNTINVIRNQNNDQSAVKTVNKMLKQKKKSGEAQKAILDAVIGMLPTITEHLMKMASIKTPAPMPAPQPSPAKAKQSKTKSKK